MSIRSPDHFEREWMSWSRVAVELSTHCDDENVS